MARDFDGGADYMTVTSIPASGYPFTLAGWFNADNVTTAMQIVGWGELGVANRAHVLTAGGTIAGDPVVIQNGNGTLQRSAISSTGFTAGTWHHAAGVSSSATSRIAYIDGVGGAENTASAVIGGAADTTRIGVLVWSSNLQFFNGRIGECAVWDVALTSDEIATMAAGYSPLFIRPGNLVRYWQIHGNNDPEIDIVGGANLSLVSAPPKASDHPQIIYPSADYFGLPAAVAAPSAGVGTHGSIGRSQIFPQHSGRIFGRKMTA